MGLTQFTDSAGRSAYKDDKGMVYTENGSRATNYNVNDWNTRQSQKYGSSSSSTGNSSVIQNAIKMSQDANKPAISSLQSSIKPTTQNFDTRIGQLEAEKAPLQQRYQSLIDSIKGNQATSENRQTVTTRNELGKRGIPLTSGVAEQEVVNAVNPVTQQYTGMIQDTGYQQEADLRNLANQVTNLGLDKTSSIQAINNAIAQLQSGATTQGINLGTNMYNTQLQQDNFTKQQALAEKMFSQVTLPQSQNQRANSNKSSVSLVEELSTLQKQFPQLFGGAKQESNSTDKYIYG